MEGSEEYKVENILKRIKNSILGNQKDEKMYDTLLDELIKTLTKENTTRSEVNTKDLCLKEILRCDCCQDIFYEPITLKCGHTFCKMCIKKRQTQNLIELCIICLNKSCGNLKWHFKNRKSIDSYKCNVALSSVLRDCFRTHLEAARLRFEGNEYFTKQDICNAKKKYKEAVNRNPSCFLSWSNLSNCAAKEGNYEEALLAAEKACVIAPWWGKGFYREGIAYQGLKCYAESLVSFLKFLLLEPSNDIVYEYFIKSLNELMLKMDISSLNEESEYLSMDIDQIKSEEQSSQTLGKDFMNIENQGKIDFVLKSLIKQGLKFSKSPKKGYYEDRCEEENEAMINDLEKMRIEFSCPLCCRILYEATTTSCGHTFCSSCLERSLDYSNSCGICRKSLNELISVRPKPINTVIDNLVQKYFNKEYQERLASSYIETQVYSENEDLVTIPIFVCTFTYPTLDCPLHIFEPRYKLLIRRCLQSGIPTFGMCMYEEGKAFSDYGIMLEIKEHRVLNDGRFLIDAVGGRRFKVHERGRKDGYNTATVSWINDVTSAVTQQESLQICSNRLYNDATEWFNRVPNVILNRLQMEYGALPAKKENELTSEHGPHWLWWLLRLLTQGTPHDVLNIIQSTNLEYRLNFAREKLAYMNQLMFGNNDR